MTPAILGAEAASSTPPAKPLRASRGSSSSRWRIPASTPCVAGAAALDTGAQAIVTTCQQCVRTMATYARRNKAPIEVLDLTQILERSAQAYAKQAKAKGA